MGHDPSRTEPATHKRITEARNKGQVAKSRDIGSLAVLLGGLAVLAFMSNFMLEGIATITRDTLALVARPAGTIEEVHTILGQVMLRSAWILLPIFAVTLVCAVGANVAQVGWLWTMEPLIPKWDKLNPVAGMGRLFSPMALVETAKSMFKFAIIGWFAWKVINRELTSLPGIMDETPYRIVSYMFRICGEIVLRVSAILAIIAAADYLYQRFEYMKGLRMTKEEVKEEHRAAEGDPAIRGKIKQLMREKARRLILREVPKADVVITNPTHYAVALKYDRTSMQAPVLTAKGRDLMAKRIRDLAREHGVPVVERPPLARALFSDVDEGCPIPFELYKAVAEVLAYVYRLNNRKIAV